MNCSMILHSWTHNANQQNRAKKNKTKNFEKTVIYNKRLLHMMIQSILILTFRTLDSQ